MLCVAALLISPATQQIAHAETVFRSEPAFPHPWGTVAETHTGRSGREVVLIQDIHAHAKSQLNIRNLLKFFHDERGIDLVGLCKSI